MLIVTTAGLRSIIGSGLTLQNWLDGLTLRLFKGTSAPVDVNITTAQILESTFPGYAPQLLGPFSPPVTDANNNQFLMAPEHDFLTTGVSGESILGAYGTGLGGETMVIESAVTPIPVPAGGLSFAVIPLFYAGQIQPPL